MILYFAKTYLSNAILLVNMSISNLLQYHTEHDVTTSYLRWLVNWSYKGWATYATKYRKGEIRQEMNVDSYLYLLHLQVKQIIKYYVTFLPVAWGKGHYCCGKIWHFSEYMNFRNNQKKGEYNWKRYLLLRKMDTADNRKLLLLMLKDSFTQAHHRKRQK